MEFLLSIAVAFFLVLQTSGAFSQKLSPVVDTGDWASIASYDTVCRYELHLHGSLSKVRATPANILFRSENVLVIKGEGGLRHLAFRDKGGGCHEQSRIICEPKADVSFLSRGAPTTKEASEKETVSDGCLNDPCHADADDFALSLSRVMIAASLGPRPTAKHVAVIGLGGGMIPLWFQQKRPSIGVDAIDVSANVVAAVHCFGVVNGTGMNVVHQDGRMFLQQQPLQKYDAVMLDAFDENDNIPPCLRTIEFFKMVKSRLRNDGGLVINTWRKNLDVMLVALEQVFDKVLVCKSPGLGNIVVHATSSSLKLPPSPSEQKDDSFFGNFLHKHVSRHVNVDRQGPSEWLANLEFIHPPRGWVLYPQYHQEQSTGSTGTPATPTAKPFLTGYVAPEVETDAHNKCKYSNNTIS